MITYLFQRLGAAAVTLLGVLCITFFLFQAIPGDPADALVGERADPAVKARYAERLGTTRGPLAQFGGYLAMLGTGDMGVSYFTGTPVAALIATKLPNTALLALSAMVLSTALAIPLGIILSRLRNRWLAVAAGATHLVIISTPVYWLAIVAVLLFVGKLHLIPGIGRGDGSLVYCLLPALVLGIKSCCYNAAIFRTSLDRQARSPAVEAMRARGLAPSRQLLHIALNASLPFITAAGLDLGSYLGGSILTETIFAWDGIGRLAMEAILKRDYPLILGVIITCSCIFILINAAVDLLYAAIDPRIRHSQQR